MNARLERLEEGDRKTRWERLDTGVTQEKNHKITFEERSSPMFQLGSSFQGFEFSNPGGAGSSGDTTGGVLMEVFHKLKETSKILEVQVRELQAFGEDSINIVLVGVVFNSKAEFITYYKLRIRKLMPDKTEAFFEVQCYFTDASGLLVMMIKENNEAITKDSASLEVMAKKANYQGVDSMVFKNSFGKVLPEVFGKNKTDIITWMALPWLPTFVTFDTQVKDTSWRSNIMASRSRTEMRY